MDELILIIFPVVSLALLLFCLILYRKLIYLTTRYKEFMADGNGASLEAGLRTIHSDIRDVSREVLANRERMRELAAILDTATRGIGVVRFNAFQDTGSDLSFAVAYIDANKNGVVISSIYGREESRTYAKPLENGNSHYQLSEEEQEAIRRAGASLRTLSDGGREAR